MFRQVAWAACLLFWLNPLGAQQKSNRLLPRYLTVGTPDQEAGGKRLAAWRAQGIGGDYFLSFDLETLPRRGPGRTIPGQWWGTQTTMGPLSRVHLTVAEGKFERWLVQNGVEPRVWRQSAEETSANLLPIDAWFNPIAGTNLSAFDLEMPFTYWTDWTYEGVTRVRGRAAHAFLLYAPADLIAAHPDIAGVRVFLDDQFDALLQATQLNADEKPIKTMTVLDLKRLNDQWIVKSVEVRDEVTRDKTRFVVNGAKLGLSFTSGLFAPAALGQPVKAPDGIESFQ